MEAIKTAEHRLYQKAADDLGGVIIDRPAVLAWYQEFDEKLRLADLYGKTVLVTKTQFPEVREMAEKAAALAGTETVPVYIYEDFYYGAQAKGSEKPWLEISAKTVRDFSGDELLFLIAREFWLIAKGAATLAAEAQTFEKMLGEVSLVPGQDMIAKGLRLKYARWSRLAGYSADCFGYIATQKIRPCISAILNLILNNRELAARMNLKEYLAQADKINRLDDEVSRYTKNDELTPYGPFRIKNILAFASIYGY